MNLTPEEISSVWAKISGLLTRLEDLFPSNAPQIQSFYQSLSSVGVNFSLTTENAGKRQFLIDQQCASHQFGGNLHEKYHRINTEIDANLNNLFSSIKTSLNRLTSLFYSLIPHPDKKGISEKSFGALINSLDKKTFENKVLEKIRIILTSRGREIDETINDYRDDYIEHVRNPSHGLLASTPNSLKRIHKSVLSVEQPLKAKSKTSKTKTGWPAVKLIQENEEYLYYVHVEPSLRDGTVTKKGQEFGIISDGNTGHFEKYGLHYHVFSSPCNQTVPLGIEGTVSPELYESLEKFTEFIYQIVKKLTFLNFPNKGTT